MTRRLVTLGLSLLLVGPLLAAGVSSPGAAAGTGDVGSTILASQAWLSSRTGNGTSITPSLSGDGQWLTFQSGASDLVDGDTNNQTDVFAQYRPTGSVWRLTDGDNFSGLPVISADGGTVAFASAATDLVTDDSNHEYDIFAAGTTAGGVERISVSAAGSDANGSSPWRPAISNDGRFVAFASRATNLVSPASTGIDVFLRDRQLHTTVQVSRHANGTDPSGVTGEVSISGDGSRVAFTSYSPLTSDPHTGSGPWIYVYDVTDGQLLPVNKTPTGSVNCSNCRFGSIASDGQSVVFESSVGLVATDGDGFFDTYRWSVDAQVITPLTVSISGHTTTTQLLLRGTSRSNRFVTFGSADPALVAGDTNNAFDLFVLDTESQTVERVNLDSGGQQDPAPDQSANLESGITAITDDGSYVAFSSRSLLAGDDQNLTGDVFVRRRAGRGLIVTPAQLARGRTYKSVSAFWSDGHGPDLRTVDSASISGVGVSLTLRSKKINDVNLDITVDPDAALGTRSLVLHQSATDSTFTCDDCITIVTQDTDGDYLTDDQETALGTNPRKRDTDGDGLQDGWEVSPLEPGAGIRVNYNQHQITLPTVSVLGPYQTGPALSAPQFGEDYRIPAQFPMGGLPNAVHPDLFVEIDWQDCKVSGCPVGDPMHHAPSWFGLRDAVQLFAQPHDFYPEGIDLHVLVDEAVDHNVTCDQNTSAYRHDHFGTPTQRRFPPVITAKAKVVRYAWSGHSTAFDDTSVCPNPGYLDLLFGSTLPDYDYTPFGMALKGGRDILISVNPVWYCPGYVTAIPVGQVCEQIRHRYISEPDGLDYYFDNFAAERFESDTMSGDTRELDAHRIVYGKAFVHLLGHSLAVRDNDAVNDPLDEAHTEMQWYGHVKLKFKPGNVRATAKTITPTECLPWAQAIFNPDTLDFVFGERRPLSLSPQCPSENPFGLGTSASLARVEPGTTALTEDIVGSTNWTAAYCSSGPAHEDTLTLPH